MIRAVLCDIEGTTTALSFVHEVLFPLSRKEIGSYVREHWNDPDMKQLFEKLGSSTDDVVRLLISWIDADKKEGALKEIQGRIWKKGFESGEIQSHIYPDVPKRWSEWKDRGIKIYIFSSGSIEAQKLLFRYSEAGDLTSYIQDYFDTTTGPKKEPESYRKIAALIGFHPEEILFLSDVQAELDAAKSAGMKTTQIIRDPAHPLATSFDDL